MMKKVLFGLGVIGLTLLALTGCENVKVPPDILLSSVDPLAFYVNDTTKALQGLSISVVPRNSVDSYLDCIQWEYYDKDGIQVGSTSECFRIYARVPGKRDTVLKESTIVYALIVPVDYLVNYMVSHSQFSGSVRLIVTAASEYDPEQTDTASCAVGMYRIVTYSITVTANRDSIAVNDTTGIVAAVRDVYGRAVVGEQVNFSADVGSVNPTSDVTDASGNAHTVFTAPASPGIANVTGQCSRAGAFTLPITVY
jgi:hypothetical protein